jgi:molecular chaperone GrpE
MVIPLQDKRMTQDQNDKHKHKEKEKMPESAGIEPSNSSVPLVDSGDGVQESGSGEVKEETKEESVTIPLKEYATQMKDIDDLKNKLNDYSEGWMRERADFTNYRSRILRDEDITKQDITAQVVKKYLAVNDDIELALNNAPKNGESANWVKGIQLIAQKLQNILELEGVQRIPAEKEFFDPNRHEAMATEENPLFESGQIIEIIQQGYTIGDRVIRPARVKIAK